MVSVCSKRLCCSKCRETKALPLPYMHVVLLKSLKSSLAAYATSFSDNAMVTKYSRC